jgi:hypothetical protein
VDGDPGNNEPDDFGGELWEGAQDVSQDYVDNGGESDST